MSPDPTTTDPTGRLDERARRRRGRRALTGIVLATILLAALAALAGGPAAAQNNSTTNASAGYYNNTTATVDNESWLAGREDATLEDQVAMLTRLSTVVIGSGPETQGGGGPAGVLVFGFLVAGTGTAMLGRSQVGAVGGATVFVALAAGIVELGFAPRWMWALILLGIGTILTTAYLRSV